MIVYKEGFCYKLKTIFCNINPFSIQQFNYKIKNQLKTTAKQKKSHLEIPIFHRLIQNCVLLPYFMIIDIFKFNGFFLGFKSFCHLLSV